MCVCVCALYVCRMCGRASACRRRGACTGKATCRHAHFGACMRACMGARTSVHAVACAAAVGAIVGPALRGRCRAPACMQPAGCAGLSSYSGARCLHSASAWPHGPAPVAPPALPPAPTSQPPCRCSSRTRRSCASHSRTHKVVMAVGGGHPTLRCPCARSPYGILDGLALAPAAHQRFRRCGKPGVGKGAR